MTAATGTPARTIVDQSTQNVWLLRAVSSETTVHGLVAVTIGHGSRQAANKNTSRFEAAGHFETNAIRSQSPGPVSALERIDLCQGNSRGQGQGTTACISLPGSPKTSELTPLANE
jgi:hypothetical protein